MKKYLLENYYEIIITIILELYKFFFKILNKILQKYKIFVTISSEMLEIGAFLLGQNRQERTKVRQKVKNKYMVIYMQVSAGKDESTAKSEK